MEEEIDLRPYFEALLRNWKWIIGAGVLSAAMALGISFLIPPTYEATALVAVTEPGQLVQFDPRFAAVDEPQPLRAYPELARSDELLQEFLDTLDPPLSDVASLEKLRGVASAEAGSDPSLVRLTIAHGSAPEAARAVNTWAQLFVTRANQIYGDLGGGQVVFFESQLEEARQDLDAADQALISFEARDRTTIIANQLASLEREQADSLARQREIAFLIQDIEGLRNQLDRNSSNVTTLADQLTSLFLQVRAFGAQANVPLQFQLDPGTSLTSQDRAEQTAYLSDIVEMLSQKSADIEDRLSELEPRILVLQQRRQELAAENGRLVRDRELADETYTALARKVEEERITSQDTSSGVRLASRAAVPERPVSPRKLINAIMAGAMGGVLAVFIVIVVHWWRTEDTGAQS